MKIAALYDIHGNLPALKAVMRHVELYGADEIIIGGDVVLGPMPLETLEFLLNVKIPVKFIRGNCESEMLALIEGKNLSSLPQRVIEAIRWVSEQLTFEHIQIISEWPATISIETKDIGKVLFCHATPRNDTEIFTKLTDEVKLKKIFENVDANLVICGHTHMQFMRLIGGIRVINAGSVGMPYGKPGANWLMLSNDCELIHTDYDLEDTAEIIKGTAYPGAEDFAMNNILNPASEEEVLKIFSDMELKV